MREKAGFSEIRLHGVTPSRPDLDMLVPRVAY